MIIGVDAGCLGVPDSRLKVGVYHLVLGLLKAVGKVDKKNNYILYSFYPIEKKLLKSFGNNFTNKVIRPSFAWSSIWLPLEIVKNNIDVFIGLSQNLPVMNEKIKSIVVIYDLTFEKYPDHFPNSYEQLRRITMHAINKATHVIAISKSTRSDLFKKYPLVKDKVIVFDQLFVNRFADIRVNNHKKRLKKLNIKKPYILFVGTLKESKNIPNMIRGYSEFVKRNNAYDLVICGSNYWLDQEINKTLKELKVKKSIHNLGFISDNDLFSLYSQASVFLSPAYNEGLGLTYLEAASFRVPIIASKKGAVPKIFGDSIVYVNPKSPRSIARALINVTSKDKRKNDLIKKAHKKSKEFSIKGDVVTLLKLINNEV